MTWDNYEDYDPDFADPGGKSALRQRAVNCVNFLEGIPNACLTKTLLGLLTTLATALEHPPIARREDNEPEVDDVTATLTDIARGAIRAGSRETLKQILDELTQPTPF